MPVNFAPPPQQNWGAPATSIGPQPMDPRVAQQLGGGGQGGLAQGASEGADPGLIKLAEAIMKRRSQAAQPTLPAGGVSPTGITRGQNVMSSLPPGYVPPNGGWPQEPQPAPQQQPPQNPGG